MAERLVEKIRSKESADDLNYGQMVIIAARWVLVASGLFLALWSPTDVVHLRVLIVVILGLSIANFYLHTQVLQGRPALVPVVYGASAVDLIAISVIILALGGFDAPHYVFYFPAILAFSVAFRPEVTILYTGAAMFVYSAISVTALDDSPEILVARLLMIAAVAVCGGMFWSIERKRRVTVREAHDALKAQVRQQV